MSKGRWDKVV